MITTENTENDIEPTEQQLKEAKYKNILMESITIGRKSIQLLHYKTGVGIHHQKLLNEILKQSRTNIDLIIYVNF